jgi:hypothetical protein
MPKPNPELQLLNLLRAILPKAVPDPKLAETIYCAFEKEITAKERASAFEKFCKQTELPDLVETTLDEVKKQFESSFGEGAVSVVPHPQKNAASVEIVTPNGTFEGVLSVGASANGQMAEEEEFKPRFVPFPVSLEGDPELIWMLARDERMTPDEASVALGKAQEDFWESKAGQQHLRNRVERTFPEFIAKVPSKLLNEAGLKRHYKDPEPIRQIKSLKPRQRR